MSYVKKSITERPVTMQKVSAGGLLNTTASVCQRIIASCWMDVSGPYLDPATYRSSFDHEKELLLGIIQDSGASPRLSYD